MGEVEEIRVQAPVNHARAGGSEHCLNCDLCDYGITLIVGGELPVMSRLFRIVKLLGIREETSL